MSSKQIFILRLSQSIQISLQIFRLALCSSLFIREKLAATVHMSDTFVLNMVYVICGMARHPIMPEYLHISVSKRIKFK